MKPNLLIDKINSNKGDYNKYFYGPQYDVIFRFEQKFFVSQLLSIVSIPDLRILLRAQLSSINKFINEPEYICFSIPKKKGGNRSIQSPGINLMRIQSRLNFFLQNYYHLIRPEGIYGFVINPNKKEKICNIVENAKIHINKKQVLNLDLKDFFPSIQAYRVKELFVSEYFKFNEEVANALALLVTYEGKLPIGAPTSPVISNFICLQLDEMLLSYCYDKDIQYSRYADDLTFSSDGEITKSHLEELSTIIISNHFTINPKKTRLNKNHRKQTVTGLVVNEKVNVDRKTLKIVRAMLYDALQNGVSKAARKHFQLKNEMSKMSETYFLNRLDGYINFIGQVRGKEDVLVLKFKEDFKMILKLK